jgi:hypothetical protein
VEQHLEMGLQTAVATLQNFGEKFGKMGSCVQQMRTNGTQPGSLKSEEVGRNIEGLG